MTFRPGGPDAQHIPADEQPVDQRLLAGPGRYCGRNTALAIPLVPTFFPLILPIPRHFGCIIAQIGAKCQREMKSCNRPGAENRIPTKILPQRRAAAAGKGMFPMQNPVKIRRIPLTSLF